MTLVFFVVFLVIATAWLSFAVRQSHEVTDQEQEEQAFQIGEAGIERTLFFLNSGVYTQDDLAGLSAPVVGVVQDKSGKTMGSYELTFDVAGSGPLTVTALAHDIELEKRCQRVVADIESMTGVLTGPEYYVRSWDHDLDVTCGPAGVTTSLPTIRFSSFLAFGVDEGDPPAVNQAAFTIMLSHVYPLRVRVNFATTGFLFFPATPGVDYISKNETVTFDPGETVKVVMVDIVADNVWERWLGVLPYDYFRGLISSPENGTLSWPTSRTAYIIDDD